MQRFPFGRKQIEYYNNQLKELSHRYARLVGVPVVMVNKCGTWQSPVPLPWALLGGKQKSNFPGLSAIVDSDGTVKAQLGREEAVIVEDVTLDPSRKTHELPKCNGRWAFEGPSLMNLFPVLEASGRLSYSLSSERKKKARQISSSKR
jgi:N-carbamoylputrescine amidase